MDKDKEEIRKEGEEGEGKKRRKREREGGKKGEKRKKQPNCCEVLRLRGGCTRAAVPLFSQFSLASARYRH